METNSFDLFLARLPVQFRKYAMGAKFEASSLDHYYVGTEHLLAALLSESANVRALVSVESGLRGITVARCRKQIVQLSGKTSAPDGVTDMTPRFVQTFKTATSAYEVSGSLLEPSVLLFNLAIADPHSAASRVLVSLGCDVSGWQRNRD